MWGSNLNESVESGAGGFFDSSRGDASSGDKEIKRSQNIVPVFIKHLTSCKGDFKLGDLAVRMVTFVARITQSEYATTKNTYELEDDTDKITAYRWLEPGRNAAEAATDINTYVRICGQLRNHNGKSHVLITKMWPLTDLNELTNHLLEVLYVCLKIQGKSDNKGQLSSTSTVMNVDDTNDEATVGLTKEQVLVFRIIQSENDTDNGIERDILKARVPKHILPQVDKIIDFLISEGHIYSTLSDDYFKTT